MLLSIATKFVNVIVDAKNKSTTKFCRIAFLLELALREQHVGYFLIILGSVCEKSSFMSMFMCLTWKS